MIKSKILMSTTISLWLAACSVSPENTAPPGVISEGEKLQAQGWTVDKIKQSFLGDWVIEGHTQKRERKLVMSADGAEVYRDYIEENDDHDRHDSDRDDDHDRYERDDDDDRYDRDDD